MECVTLQKMTPKNIMDLFIVYTISKKTKDILVRNFLPKLISPSKVKERRPENHQIEAQRIKVK